MKSKSNHHDRCVKLPIWSPSTSNSSAFVTERKPLAQILNKFGVSQAFWLNMSQFNQSWSLTFQKQAAMKSQKGGPFLRRKKKERLPLLPFHLEKKPVTGRLLQNEKLTATASPLQTEAKNSCHPTPANYNPTTPAITYTLPGLVLFLCHGKSGPLKKCHPHPVFFLMTI